MDKVFRAEKLVGTLDFLNIAFFSIAPWGERDVEKGCSFCSMYIIINHRYINTALFLLPIEMASSFCFTSTVFLFISFLFSPLILPLLYLGMSDGTVAWLWRHYIPCLFLPLVQSDQRQLKESRCCRPTYQFAMISSNGPVSLVVRVRACILFFIS